METQTLQTMLGQYAPAFQQLVLLSLVYIPILHIWRTRGLKIFRVLEWLIPLVWATYTMLALAPYIPIRYWSLVVAGMVVSSAPIILYSIGRSVYHLVVAQKEGK